MAPNLAKSQHNLLRDMILDGSLNNKDMAYVAGCSDRTVRAIRSNLRLFGSTKAPFNGAGRRRRITPTMLETLLEHLIEKPELYQDEMALFLSDEFNVTVTISSISRALASARWTKTVARQIAKERNKDLRDFYLYNISAFRSYHLVFVDESGCDKRIGFRRTGWSPLGTAPVQTARFHRDDRYQIIPAYTQDGVIFSRVSRGTTDGDIFADYVEQLLHHCGRWPEPHSVLVMDNATIHHGDRIEMLCFQAGVKLLYLPPYSPDLNPIEEFFSELKAFIKRQWKEFETNPGQTFEAFLQWCVNMVGGRTGSARGHFEHSGIHVETLD